MTTPQAPTPSPAPRAAPRAVLAASVLLLSLLVIPTGSATHDSEYECDEDGMNTQCNALGAIKMPTQVEVRGKPVLVNVTTTITDDHAEKGARYVMFSVRHDPRGGDSPISLALEGFETRHGTIFTERIETDVHHEINIWTHVADVPENTPINIQVKVGAADRGAFQLEALVMPFDRGYESLSDPGGQDVSLFSFTTLGVNGETGRVGGGSGSIIDNFRTPGFTAVPALAALVAIAVLAWRRRD